jgi:hypothetical protein
MLKRQHTDIRLTVYATRVHARRAELKKTACRGHFGPSSSPPPDHRCMDLDLMFSSLETPPARSNRRSSRHRERAVFKCMDGE